MTISSTASSVLISEYDFNKKSRRTDAARICFTKEMVLTVLFPSEQIGSRYSNMIRGRYVLDTRNEILLDVRGLQARAAEIGQLIVKTFSEPERDHDSKTEKEDPTSGFPRRAVCVVRSRCVSTKPKRWS